MSTAEVYKSTTRGPLLAHVVVPPPGVSPTGTGVVLFHGGAWTIGAPSMFDPQCTALAASGVLAISIEYRLRSPGGTSILDCVRDARSAMRWCKANSHRWGVEPDRIAAGGGSAGGHLAACLLVHPPNDSLLDDLGDDQTISPTPAACVLFNPTVDLRSGGATGLLTEDDLRPDAALLSPIEHVRPGLAPVLVQHGVGDQVVPIDEVRQFRDAMVTAGNRCELVEYADADHGFFNRGVADGRWFEVTTDRAIAFLTDVLATSSG